MGTTFLGFATLGKSRVGGMTGLGDRTQVRAEQGSPGSHSCHARPGWVGDADRAGERQARRLRPIGCTRVATCDDALRDTRSRLIQDGRFCAIGAYCGDAARPRCGPSV